MPLKKQGKFVTEARSSSGRIHVPAALVRDSQFPLEEGPVEIVIEGDMLQVRQSPENTNKKATTF